MIEKFTVEIEVGDRVEMGRMHLANQTVKAIEIDKWGHPVMVLSSGRKRGLFNMRLKYKKQGNPLQLVIKLVMNAAYGICGLKPIDTDIKYVQDGDKYANFVNNHFNRIKWFNRMNNNEWRFELYKEIDTHYNRQHVACEILSVSKNIMNEVMCLA